MKYLKICYNTEQEFEGNLEKMNEIIYNNKVDKETKIKYLNFLNK